MAAGLLAISAYTPARDRQGRLVPGARMDIYANRTTTRATVYADGGLTTPLPNPVIANAAGQFPSVWSDGGSEDDPLLFTLAYSAFDGSSIGNPSTFDDVRPSVSLGLVDAENKVDLSGANIEAPILFRTNIDAAPRNKITYAVDQGVKATGTSDDTAALQRAIDLAQDVQGVGVIELPVGVMRISGLLRISRGNVIFVGAGSGASIIRQTADNTGGLLVKGSAGVMVSGVVVSGVSFDVAGGVNTGTSGVGLEAHACVNFKTHDVTAKTFHTNLKLAGVFVGTINASDFVATATTPDTRINVYVTAADPDMGGGISGNIRFMGMESRSTTGLGGAPGADYGLLIDAVDGLWAPASYFGYCKIAGIRIIKIDDLVAGIDLTACWADAHEGACVELIAFADIANGSISICNMNAVGGVLADRIVAVVGMWSDFKINNNHLKWARIDVIYVGPGARNFQVNDNHVQLANSDAVGSGECIRVEGQDGTVSDNLIDGLGATYQQNAILLVNPTGIVAVGNRGKGCQNGLTTSGVMTDSTLLGNRMSGCVSPLVLGHSDGGGNIVDHNA